MNPLSKLTSAMAAAALLASCVESTGGTRDSSAATRMPSLAEQGCLRDVTRTTNNPDVVLLTTSESEAGAEVIVGVGPQRARWRCIGYKDGTTSSIMSMTDEGGM